MLLLGCLEKLLCSARQVSYCRSNDYCFLAGKFPHLSHDLKRAVADPLCRCTYPTPEWPLRSGNWPERLTDLQVTPSASFRSSGEGPPPARAGAPATRLCGTMVIIKARQQALGEGPGREVSGWRESTEERRAQRRERDTSVGLRQAMSFMERQDAGTQRPP